MAAVARASGVAFGLHDPRRTVITMAEGLDLSAYALKRLLNHRGGDRDVTAGYIVLGVERYASRWTGSRGGCSRSAVMEAPWLMPLRLRRRGAPASAPATSSNSYAERPRTGRSSLPQAAAGYVRETTSHVRVSILLPPACSPCERERPQRRYLGLLKVPLVDEERRSFPHQIVCVLLGIGLFTPGRLSEQVTKAVPDRKPAGQVKAGIHGSIPIFPKHVTVVVGQLAASDAYRRQIACENVPEPTIL